MNTKARNLFTRADSFFGDGAGTTPGAGEYKDSHAEQEGDVIGTYKRHQQVGEGGFGMVWIKDVIATLLGRITIDKTVCHGEPTTRGLCFPVVVFPEYPAAWFAGGVSIRRPRGDSQTGYPHESAVLETRKFFAT